MKNIICLFWPFSSDLKPLNFLSTDALLKGTSLKATLCLLIVVFISGCVTQRRCLQKFPVQSDTIKTVITKDSIIYRDTTIYVHLPEIVKTDSVQIPCPEPPPFWIPDTAKVETDYATAKAWFDFPNIQLSLKQKGDLKIQLENAVKDAWHWRSEFEKITVVPEPVKYIPKIYKQALSICIFIFAAGFIFLGWKLFKFLKK